MAIGGDNELTSIVGNSYVIWSLPNDNYDGLDLINRISRAKKVRDTFLSKLWRDEISEYAKTIKNSLSSFILPLQVLCCTHLKTGVDRARLFRSPLRNKLYAGMDLAFKVEPTAKESPPPKNEKAIETKYADETLRILELHGDSVGPLTTEKEKKLRRKLYWRIFGLLSAINLLLFVGSLFDLLFAISNFF